MTAPRHLLVWRNAPLIALLWLALADDCQARVPRFDVAVRPQDQIWLVSTRAMGPRPSPRKTCAPRYCYQRYQSCNCWYRQSAGAFFACNDPCTTNVLYVHGNRMTEAWVKSRGLELYQKLVCNNPDRPIRMIIWSWPSSPLPRRAAVFRDARVKLRRTPLQSYYLAHWLSCFDCHERVALLGYSYGGRTILGALHLLGGGNLNGRCLDPCCRRCLPQMRMALWAPATQSDWLLPGQPHDRALCCLERGLIFYNHCDPVLSRFQRYIFSVTGPALGHVGLTCAGYCIPGYERILQFDATWLVGKQHKWNGYTHCPSIMWQIRNLALDQ